MIKFTEIYEDSGMYDSESQTIKQTYNLRDIFVNPRYVIYVRKNMTLKNKAEKVPLVPGLSQELNYTQMMFMVPSQSIKTINVIGELDYIASVL